MTHGHQTVELTLLSMSAKAVQAKLNNGRVHWIPFSAMINPDFSDFTEGLVKNFWISDWFIRKVF